ncbi:hypothetical protein EI94DRAFT_1772698 [Lactarius quietus]|nr:hypothetical protein EI94DRAFT_1772698 [Lactarius quietus]
MALTESGEDPDDAIDADILQALTQYIDPSPAGMPEQWHSASSDHTESMGSRIDNPVPPPHIHLEPGNSGGASPMSSIWAPFCSQRDWEIVRWAKMCGPTSSALAELLAIPEIVDRLGLSYRTPKELNEIIWRPPFQCHELVVAGETLQFYFRDILPCISSLFGDPEFACDLVFAPERHYADNEWTSWVYSEMNTGDWWWAVQVWATVVPIIISSDKTQLTLFRGKVAYPLEEMGNQTARRCALGNVYHSCMQKILAPITACSETGVAMLSGDGIWHRCHPILAAFVGDYPEQALVTCMYQGRCPKCVVPPEELGNYFRSPPRNYNEVLATFRLAEGDVHAFHSACRKAGLKPVFHPFWAALPLVDIFISITPDILHQLLQGVMKHLIAWVTSAFGATIIDACCRSMPPNHNITTFIKGISVLSRVTGLEHMQMCKILLGLLIDLSLPSGKSTSRIIKSVRALLDFLYLAQLPSHTSDTLLRLEDALASFHDHKDVFVEIGVHDHFHFPKIHSLIHYQSSITLFGTTDNYNTEQTERLHIEYTKWAFRTTNKKEESPQMTTWNECPWRQQAQQECERNSILDGPPVPVLRSIHMTLHPSLKAVSFNDLAVKYGALDFQDALADFIACVNHPEASTTALKDLAENTLLLFQTVPVFHRIKYISTCYSEVIDTVHVWPEQSDARGNPIPSQFDTVIVQHGSQTQVGAHRNKGKFQLCWCRDCI